MKILYAASNNQNAKIQLIRFLHAVEGKPYQIKIAAYKQSSPSSNVDWTLDALLNIYKPDYQTINNDNLAIYYEQVKQYSPDLIISDLEYYTSYIANVLNIPIWQCSSSLINCALQKKQKYNMGLFKYHAFSVNRDPRLAQGIVNLLDNSTQNFVYSHFCDLKDPLSLKEGFEWIRPYHRIGKESILCQHGIVAGLAFNNKKVIHELKRRSDSVVFMEPCTEIHQNVLVKDIGNQEEYFCNLKNSRLFVCQGQTSFLADAFYNGKHPLIYPDYNDAESITNSIVSEHFKVGTIVTQPEMLDTLAMTTEPVEYNQSVKYLHEKIEEL